MTENEWLTLIKGSPQKAYRELVGQYGSLVYAIVLSKLKGCGTREEIDDCVSDVFVEIFRNSENYKGSGSLKSYISTIAKRTAINTYKSIMQQRRSTGSLEDVESEIRESGDTPDSAAEKNQLRERLWEIVKSLGEPDHSIILYQYFYRLRAKDIARKLSMSTDAVNKRSLRAREKIRKILESEDLL